MWRNDDGTAPAWSVAIPYVLSLLETLTWDSPVPGLDQVRADERPPVVVSFYAFRVMVGIDVLLFLVSAWGLVLWLRGKLQPDQLVRRRWFLRALVFSSFLPI